MKKILLLIVIILLTACQAEPIEKPVTESTCEQWHPAPQAYYGEENKMVGVTESLWPEMKIKVYIDEDFEGEHLEWLNKAMASYEAIGFEFEVSDEFFIENGLNFKLSGISRAAIGMQGDIIQDVYLPTWGSQAAYEHEIGHALGAHHPHVTKLRDELLTIHWNNIAEENHDFYKTYEEYDENYTGQKEGAEYLNYFPTSSVMAYGSFAHSVDGSKPAYTLKDGTLIKAAKTLTESDKEMFTNMYCEIINAKN